MKVLVAEDDLALATYLQQSLEREGYEVLCARNGDDARSSILKHEPDLLLLDLGLPQTDGVEVLRAVHGLVPAMSIIVLTGRAQVSHKIECLNLGADDYLVKPFSLHELMARCRAVRRRRANSASSFLRHDNLQINRITREVTLAGRIIELTSKEFCLLEYLLVQRGRAVSRQELLREVWRMAPDAGTNVVDVYVNYLRRKLAVDPSGNIIETVRGAGYGIGTKMTPSKPPVSDLGLPLFRLTGLA
ncbi:MAG: response regulator transcription factor [Janthinobacterium lividum]